MSFKQLLSTSLWLAIGATSLPACTSLRPSGISTHTWPTHGNQYYNYWNAKYLGGDSTSELSYRLIDSATFAEIRDKYNGALDDSNAIQHLVGSSRPIIIDSAHIQADLQWVRDSSIVSGREYQIYLFLDRNTARISSAHGEPGSNRTSHPFIESDRNHGMVSPIAVDSPRNGNRILIGQVHGHPAAHDGVVLHRMSPTDSLTAVCLQAPIYAIDAMDGSQGAPGSIHRANPNPGTDFNGQDLYVGKTWGLSGVGGGNTFNIGLNALHIWGISQQPKFAELQRIDQFYTAAQPSHHPNPDFDR